jgi:hypothetical protein
MGQSVYVSGGAAEILGGWTPTRDFWRLEWGEEEWEALEPMPEPRLGHRMVTHEGRIYVWTPMSRASWEVYLSDPASTPEDDLLTEIFMQVD